MDFLNDDLRVDSMQISPAYAYSKAPDQEHFPGVRQTKSRSGLTNEHSRKSSLRLSITTIMKQRQFRRFVVRSAGGSN